MKSGEAEVCVHRHDWPNSRPFVSVGLLVLAADIEVYLDSNDDAPMQVWQRLTELANAASVASQQLLAMIASGQWK